MLEFVEIIWCGKQTEQRAKELKQTNVGVKLVVVGKKGMTFFNRRREQYDIAGWSATVHVACLGAQSISHVQLQCIC